MVKWLRDKKRRAFIGGVSALIVGAWMIFVSKDNLGFIPALLGIIIILFGNKGR